MREPLECPQRTLRGVRIDLVPGLSHAKVRVKALVNVSLIEDMDCSIVPVVDNQGVHQTPDHPERTFEYLLARVRQGVCARSEMKDIMTPAFEMAL